MLLHQCFHGCSPTCGVADRRADTATLGHGFGLSSCWQVPANSAVSLQGRSDGKWPGGLLDNCTLVGIDIPVILSVCTSPAPCMPCGEGPKLSGPYHSRVNLLWSPGCGTHDVTNISTSLWSVGLVGRRGWGVTGKLPGHFNWPVIEVG